MISHGDVIVVVVVLMLGGGGEWREGVIGLNLCTDLF